MILETAAWVINLANMATVLVSTLTFTHTAFFSHGLLAVQHIVFLVISYHLFRIDFGTMYPETFGSIP